jgi:hypothetical protein
MSTATPPVTVQPPTKTAADPAIYKILDDGTVLYRTYQQAESAKLLQAGSQPDTTAKKMSQVKYGEMYLTKDGQTVPYTLGSLAEFQLTGLIVVIVVLSGLSIICAALGRLIKSLDCGAVSESAIPSPALEQPPPPAPATGIHPGLTDQHLLVLLSAAACEAIGRPVRIERFRSISKAGNWAEQGRSELHSHRLK